MLRAALIASLLLSFLAAAVQPVSAEPEGAAGARREGAEPTMTASGEVLPHNLPRGSFAPAGLRLSFTSAAIDGSGSPDLAGIAIDLSRMVRFQAAGLPSCPLAALYAPKVSARGVCADSLVGAGSVASEIALPGQAPVAVVGGLQAFYSQTGGRPRILARVVTGDPLPLTYVIPFEIVDRGPSATSLIVMRMDRLQGQCRAAGGAGCFGQPYTLEGVYSHISSLKMSLHRFVSRGGRRGSFVTARCPAPGRQSAAMLSLGRVSLSYAAGGALSAPLLQRCAVSGA
jgi:hypothetical protein